MQTKHKRFKIAHVIIFLFLLFFCLKPSRSFSDENASPQIKAVSYSDKKKISIGEPLRYTTGVTVSKDIEVEFPALKGSIANFEIRSAGKQRSVKIGQTQITQWYTLASYETGEKIIPGAAIRYRRKGEDNWNTLTSNDVIVMVESVFEKAKITNDIKGIELPVRFIEEYKNKIFIALLGFIVGIFILIFLIRRQIEAIKERRKGLPAQEVAYRSLNNLLSALHNKKALSAQDLIELAQLTKDYLDKAFDLKTAGLTTDEFLSRLSNYKDFFEKYSGTLGKVLRMADLAKFANCKLPIDNAGRDLDSIKKLIDSAREKEE